MFVNNFWGPNRQEGYAVVSQRIKHGSQTMLEIMKYYADRMAVEHEYIKRLEKMNRSAPLGSAETGLLKVSLDKFAAENTHQVANTSKQLKLMESNLRDLREFAELYELKTARCLGHMAKVLRKVDDAHQRLDTDKTKFQEACLSAKGLKLQCQTTWGKELERHQAKLARAQAKIDASRQNYQLLLTTYNELVDIYKKDWAVALSDLYKLELERLQLVKVNCFNFCNVIATYCVDQDASVDVARTAFAQINPHTDLTEFTRAYATGNQTGGHEKFVDFAAGEAGDGTTTVAPVKYHDPHYNPILSKPLLAPEAQPARERGSPVRVSSLDPRAQEVAHQHGAHAQVHPASRAVEAALTYAAVKPPTASGSPPKARRKPPKDYDSDNNELFSDNDRLRELQGSSNYLEPTNYTLLNYSLGTQASKRTWNSPRKGERQLAKVQDTINRQLQLAAPPPAPSYEEQKVNIMKDFSVDFLSKALEDLNNGGTGDISRFRRSVRHRASHGDSLGASTRAPATAPATQPTHERSSTRALEWLRPQLDFIDDSNEVAVRYESFNFNRPKLMYAGAAPSVPVEPLSRTKTNEPPYPQTHPYQNQSSLKLQGDVNGFTQSARHSVAGNPTGFGALHIPFQLRAAKRHLMPASLRVTPATHQPYVGKARAKYTFKPQQHGELYFRKGWGMYVIHRQEDNWYMCELAETTGDGNAGAVGLVPGNYVVEGDDVF